MAHTGVTIAVIHRRDNISLDWIMVVQTRKREMGLKDITRCVFYINTFNLKFLCLWKSYTEANLRT